MNSSVARVIQHTQNQRKLRIAHNEAVQSILHHSKVMGIYGQLVHCFRIERTLPKEDRLVEPALTHLLNRKVNPQFIILAYVEAVEARHESIEGDAT